MGSGLSTSEKGAWTKLYGSPVCNSWLRAGSHAHMYYVTRSI